MSARKPNSVAEQALARAGVYELFAHCFAYPDAERVEALRDVAQSVLERGRWLPAIRLAAVARQSSREALEPVYVPLMTFSSAPDCPAFETAYFGGDVQQQTQRMADIAGFYRAFGVDATSGGLRPDDLPVELEFMAYLTRKEAYAREHLGAPRTAQARRAQCLFLGDHLGRWAAVFGRRIAESAVGHFYGLAGETLAIWIRFESQQLNVSADEVEGPVAANVSGVSHGPEFAGRHASFVPIEEFIAR